MSFARSQVPSVCRDGDAITSMKWWARECQPSGEVQDQAEASGCLVAVEDLTLI